MCSVRQSVDTVASAYAAHLSQASSANNPRSRIISPSRVSPTRRTSTPSVNRSILSKRGDSSVDYSSKKPSTNTTTGLPNPDVSFVSRPDTAAGVRRSPTRMTGSSLDVPSDEARTYRQSSVKPINLRERKGLVNRRDVPEPLAHTLDHIVGQVIT
jgi:hypothetical protein